ncbi:hypothetical protein Vretimale_2658, partial [Volvox reticuliferus]
PEPPSPSPPSPEPLSPSPPSPEPPSPSNILDYNYLTTSFVTKARSLYASCDPWILNSLVSALAKSVGLPDGNVTMTCTQQQSSAKISSGTHHRRHLSQEGSKECDPAPVNQPTSFNVDPLRDMVAFRLEAYNAVMLLDWACPLGPVNGSWAVTGSVYRASESSSRSSGGGGGDGSGMSHMHLIIICASVVCGCLLILVLLAVILYRRKKVHPT